MTTQTRDWLFLSSAIIGLALLITFIVVLSSRGDAQESDPINCDTNTDARCIQQTRVARTATASAAEMLTSQAALEATVRQDVINELGLTIVAEREFYTTSIAATIADLNSSFLPAHCHPGLVEEYYPWWAVHHFYTPVSQDSVTQTAEARLEMASLHEPWQDLHWDCVHESSRAMSVVITATAESWTPTPTPTPTPNAG